MGEYDQINLKQKTFSLLKEKMAEALFPKWVLTDQTYLNWKKEKIFGRTWKFLVHKSELLEPGSYVTKWMEI